VTPTVVNFWPSRRVKLNGSPVAETNCTAIDRQPLAYEARGCTTPSTVPATNRIIAGLVTGPEPLSHAVRCRQTLFLHHELRSHLTIEYFFSKSRLPTYCFSSWHSQLVSSVLSHKDQEFMRMGSQPEGRRRPEPFANFPREARYSRPAWRHE
jgi:hypothetical protein